MRRELVERAQRGDHDAFAAIATAMIGRLDAAARLILRDPDLARDAVQEALVRVWRDLPRLREPERFEPWLHRLLVHACLDQARAHRRHRLEVELLPAHDVPLPDVGSELAVRDEIERGFRRLEPEQRAVIVLHYYLGLPLPDAAAALGIPVGTAKSRLSRAVAALRASLDAEARVPVVAGGGVA
jgi:RNA polymerase sigma-70 factor (ECF subfamily)